MRLPRPLPRAEWVWAVMIGGPALLDYWCDRGDPDNDTLSEHMRRWFRTDTAAGKFAFTLALATGASWLHGHILRDVTISE